MTSGTTNRTEPRLAPLTPDTARGSARDVLTELTERHGQVGAMVRTMAHSPAVLGGYLGLSRAMKRSKLDRRVGERISLAIQEHQGCALCLAAHTSAARAAEVDDDEIELARLGTSGDPAVAAIVMFALQVHTAPASITDAQIAELRDHGYSDRELADVVGLVALNVLTGAFNLVAGLEPDDE
ncbi:MAG: alkylhydroperoxidase [Streptosporangiales bacterium]|nr:alkylhydroperoxidase [Streptosporangiales bacterium]